MMKTGLKLAAVGMLLTLTVACCRKAPKEVGDAAAALNEAQKTCTPTYAASTFQEAESMMSRANDLVANKKCKDAKKEALATLQKVKDANTQAATEETRAKQEAESAVSAAKAAVNGAEQSVEAQNSSVTTANQEISMLVNKPEGSCDKAELEKIGSEITVSDTASSALGQAKSKLNEAESLMQESACNYYKVKEAADQAVQMANKAKSEADSEMSRVKTEESQKSTAIKEAMDAKPCSYVVQKGDSLWRIAAMDKIYGNPFMWPLIWDANKGLIKNHPDLIYPDWTFQINRTYTAEDAKNAEHTARYHKWEPPAPAAPENVTTKTEETPAPATTGEPAPAPAPSPAPATGN
jgi:nucleoid-associated protein YgaU